MRLLLPAAAFALAVTLPLPAHAQLGGLMRKAQEKAAEKLAQKAGDKVAEKAADAGMGAQPEFDNVTLELDEERVGKLAQGLKAGAELRASSNLPGFRLKVAATDSTARALDQSSSRLRSRWDDANGRVVSCYDEVMEEQSEKHEQKMRDFQAGMIRNPDQKAMETAGRRMKEAQEVMADAVQKGDEVMMEHARGLMFKAVGIDLSADTVIARGKCGALPPKPAEVVRAERLRVEADSLGVELRRLETRIRDAEVRASGMTRPQFAMALERVELWIQNQGKYGGFSPAERAVLKARGMELRDLTQGREK